MKNLIVSLSLILAVSVLTAGCSSESKKVTPSASTPYTPAASEAPKATPTQVTPASATPMQPAASSSSSASAQGKATEVKAARLSVLIPADWTLQSGEESFAFQTAKGTPVGGLDGLGYNEPDALEALLPNGAILNKKETLTGFAVPTVRVRLTMESRGSAGKREEIHYYFFLKEAKAVYDLRFDAKQVTLEQSEQIAKTAKIR